MTLSFDTKLKAQVLNKLQAADRKFKKAGKPLNYKVTDTNPLDNQFQVVVEPEDTAKYVKQYLDTLSPSQPPKLTKGYVKKLVKEIVTKTIAEKK